MAVVHVTSVSVKDNPSTLTKPIHLEISFESLQALQADIEWKVSYCCASPEANDSSSDKYFQDIDLDSINLGPIPKGSLAFEFEVTPPDYKQLSRRCLFDMHALLLTGSYKKEEFIRIGWYVNNYVQQPSPHEDIEFDDSIPLDLETVVRHVLEEDPRITRFPISWDNPKTEGLTGEGAGKEGTEDTGMAVEEANNADPQAEKENLKGEGQSMDVETDDVEMKSAEEPATKRVVPHSAPQKGGKALDTAAADSTDVVMA